MMRTANNYANNNPPPSTLYNRYREEESGNNLINEPEYYAEKYHDAISYFNEGKRFITSTN